MKQEMKFPPLPVRQEDLWSTVRFVGLRKKVWEDKPVERDGKFVYRVQVNATFHPNFKGKDGGAYLSISVPLTEDEAAKLSAEASDLPVYFEGLVAYHYEQRSFSAKSIAVLRPQGK